VSGSLPGSEAAAIRGVCPAPKSHSQDASKIAGHTSYSRQQLRRRLRPVKGQFPLLPSPPLTCRSCVCSTKDAKLGKADDAEVLPYGVPLVQVRCSFPSCCHGHAACACVHAAAAVALATGPRVHLHACGMAAAARRSPHMRCPAPPAAPAGHQQEADQQHPGLWRHDLHPGHG